MTRAGGALCRTRYLAPRPLAGVNLFSPNKLGLEYNNYWPIQRRLEHFAALLRTYAWMLGSYFRRAHTEALMSEYRASTTTPTDLKGIDTYSTTKGEPVPLMTFQHGLMKPSDFIIQTDQILGGHTEAFLDVTEENTALFHGTLRITRDPVRISTTTEAVTEEHVGYTYFERTFSKLYLPNLSVVRGVEIRCRGSQHPFFFRMRLLGWQEKMSFMHMFVPSEDWQCIILRSTHFRLTSSGAEVTTELEVEGSGALRSPIRSWGLGINCGEEDDFWLEIDYIRFVGATVFEREVSDSARMMLSTEEKIMFK